MSENESFGRLLGILSNEIARSFNIDFDDNTLTQKQRRVLHFITAKAQLGPVFQRDIEAEFNMRRSSASNMLANMEKAGVIRREAVMYDARLKRIVVTQKGEYIKEAVLNDCQRMEEKLIRNISPRELETFASVLKKMLNNLKEV